MDIAFFGSSLLSAYWNGAATYYRGILKELAALGHRITFYEPDAYGRQQHRDIEAPSWARVVVYAATQDGVERALEHARGADALVKASGVGVFDDFLEAAVSAGGRPRRLAIFWDVDAPATLDGMAADPAHPLRARLPGFDMVLTYGGGAPVTEAYRRLGAKVCVPVYNALDPETHHPVAPDPARASDLCLIANRLPDREARIDEFFLDAARRLPDQRFLLGGSGWEDKAVPPNVVRLGHVYTADHNVLNCSARMVLNVNRESMARWGFSPPTRVFEAAGAAACLISDSWPGLDLFLEPGREVLVATSGDEVAALLASVPSDTARRIGAAARRRVVAEHSYARRAAQVDALLRGGRVERRAI
ncbi:MAG: glycosyltransferase [Alphaproteobacteria bacterium]|nr:glycosyltransferase [Alphaproteobacteria bacterium]